MEIRGARETLHSFVWQDLLLDLPINIFMSRMSPIACVLCLPCLQSRALHDIVSPTATAFQFISSRPSLPRLPSPSRSADTPL